MNVTKKYESKIGSKALFEAWISPEATVYPVIKIEVEPKVGGFLKLFAEAESGIFVMTGEFLEIVKDAKLRYTWSWEGDAEKTTVTVQFKELPNGSEVSIVHEGFKTEQSRGRHDSGWDNYFEGLQKVLK